MMRRALFLLPSDRMGGAERILRIVAKEAVRSGRFDHVAIFVVCWSRTGTLDELEAMENVTLIYALASNHAIGLWRMTRFLRGKHYDLVLSSATHLNALASMLRSTGWYRTTRLVARESTVIFDREFGVVGHAFKALYWLYGAQDLIVCQTDRMRSSINRNTGGRLNKLLVTIPNPVDFDRIAAGLTEPVPAAIDAIPHDRTKIVWCGRFIPVKNPLRALDTLKALHNLGRNDMHLVMIGDGPERVAAEAHASIAGLSYYVTFTGHRPNPSNIMAACQLGLLTSDTEGFPNVILEMLASGIPRVTTTNCAGGLDEIAGVVLAADSTPGALASATLVHVEYGSDPLRGRRAADYLCTVLGHNKFDLIVSSKVGADDWRTARGMASPDVTLEREK